MTKKEQIELALKWFEKEFISAYASYHYQKDDGHIYITIGEHDYEISNEEMFHRAELTLENIEEEESE